MTLLADKTNRRWLLAVSIFFLLNIWLFWPGSLYFLNDDFIHLPLTDQQHFFQTNSVRPIHELLLRLELSLYGKHAYGYHVTALLLHFIVCIQLFDLSCLIQVRWLKINEQHASTAAFIGVVFFMIYPQHAESIAWILGRGSVLSTIFLIAATRIFIKSNFSVFSYFIGCLFFLLSLFTYEQGIFQPFMMLAVVATTKNKLLKRGQVTYASLLIVAAVLYIVIRKVITKDVVGSYEGSNFLAMNFSALLANLFRITMRLFINPGSVNYVIVSMIILLLFAGTFLLLVRKKIRINRSEIIFFSALLFVFILPVLSLGVSLHSFESGRYLYLPSFVLAMGLGIAAVHVYKMNNHYRKACLIFFGGLSVYWMYGDITASMNYKDASAYATQTNETVLKHFVSSTDTLYIDTLQSTVHSLPVFRTGFKTGIKWLNSNIDTSKIVVSHLVDESNTVIE